MTSRAFVPVEAAERSRLGLKPNLVDCRRIREVWLQRQADNQNRDSGYSVSVGIGCLKELRAIAEEEAALAIDVMTRMRDAATEILNTPTNQFYFCTAVDRLREAIAAIDAANQE